MNDSLIRRYIFKLFVGSVLFLRSLGLSTSTLVCTSISFSRKSTSTLVVWPRSTIYHCMTWKGLYGICSKMIMAHKVLHRQCAINRLLCTHVGTCTHTHTYTHTQTHVHTHTQRSKNMRMHSHTLTYTCKQTYMHIHIVCISHMHRYSHMTFAHTNTYYTCIISHM